jgi:threonine dehydratase
MSYLASAPPPPDRDDIARTEVIIRPYIRRTPWIEVAAADFGLEAATIVFKLEQLQHAGSFKARGAFANLLTRHVPPAGVIAASGGNHGVAVAFAAKTLGIPAAIFVPAISSPSKIERIRESGAALHVVGESYAEALAASRTEAARTGAMDVHAYDQAETVAGAGTLALEFEGQAGRLDTFLVPVGGGGLIAGAAAWFEGHVKIIGVEPELAPTLTRALEAGHPIDAPAGGIAADSLAPARTGEVGFPIVQKYVERVALVGDDAIREAQRALWKVLRVVAEPGGAAAFAALLSGQFLPGPGERVGVVVSGGNTTAVDFER